MNKRIQIALYALSIAAIAVPCFILADTGAADDETGHPGNIRVVDGSRSEITLADYLQEGHTTIVDFYSDACPPCRAIEPKLTALARKRPELRIVKVDMGVIKKGRRIGINWRAPVVEQFGFRSIPHFRIYDEGAKRTHTGPEAVDQLFEWLEAEGLADDS